MKFLQNIDWGAVLHVAVVSGVTYLTIRAIEQAYPVTQNVTRLPEKVVRLLPGAA